MERTGRDRQLHLSIFIKHFNTIPFISLQSTLLRGFLLAVFPAIACGCSGLSPYAAEHLGIVSFKSTFQKAVEAYTLDIFAFEDDRLRRLDSYQRFEDFIGKEVPVASTGGDKIFFFCADSGKDKDEWSAIRSYSSLKETDCRLEDESPDARCMTGECTAEAGSVSIPVTLEPLSSEIVLQAICCDFSGTAYASSVIRNARVYLTNVNASCPLMYTEGSRPTRIINTGALNQGDVGRFRYPEIIVQDIADELGRTAVYPGSTLLCYPNPSTSDSPGSPCTRMVIEGEIDSATYYWPITINDSKGIERGCRYIYDIFIRRKGATDPDIPVESSDIDIKMSIRQWKEKEGYYVGF